MYVSVNQVKWNQWRFCVTSEVIRQRFSWVTNSPLKNHCHIASQVTKNYSCRHYAAMSVIFNVLIQLINLQTTGNTGVHIRHCSYWCPGAKAPGHQYPQFWLIVSCIGPVITVIVTILKNKITFWKKIPSSLRGLKNSCWRHWNFIWGICSSLVIHSII